MKGLSRRSFLGALGALALPPWFPRLAFAAPAEAASAGDVLVCLFLRGGADGLNVVVPVGDADYHRARPTLAIPEPGSGAAAALDLDGFFALHPALAPLAELYADGDLAAVHAAGSPDETRSHFDAMDFMERGTPGEKSVTTGWIGRHLATLAGGNDSPFRAVGMGQIVQTSLRGPVPAVALQSIADFHLAGRPGEIESFQRSLASLYAGDGLLAEQAQETFAAIAILAAADPGQYQPQNGAAYPPSPVGLGLQQVAQLIRADLGLEVACVDAGGWDTHEGQGGAEGLMAGLLADFGAALAAFYADLGDRMDGVTVVTMSEFGRRLAENAAGGSDHGHGGAMLLLGGGVRGGRVYGDWPGLARERLAGPGDLAITTDFRTVLAELVEKRLGNPAVGEVFPGFVAPPYLGIF